VNPLLLNKTEDLWKFFRPSYKQSLYFSNDAPQYYPKTNRSDKFTFYFLIEIRDNFLWTVITTTPVSIFTGLAKIGGYLSLFTAMRFLLSVVHQRLFVRDLRETSGKDRIEKEFSYERL
jgi:hypothetical protein